MRDGVRTVLVALTLAMFAWVPSLRAQAPAAPVAMLDSFDELAPWQAGMSDGVTMPRGVSVA